MLINNSKQRMDYIKVLEMIIELGEAAGYSTQQKFSEATEVNQAYISMLYNKKELPRNQLDKLLRHFEVRTPIITPWFN